MILINDLSRSIQANSETLLKKIEEIIKSGKYILGDQNLKFEQEFSKYLQVRYVRGVANGTDALEIALRALGCKKGSKVAVAANAGSYAAVAANSIGCEIIYVDVSMDNCTIKIENLKSVLNSEITALVVTHLYGNVAEVDKIVEFCRNLNIFVIEDCAQSTGASIQDKKLGAFGDISTFSFYPTKNLGAIGDGGAICTNDQDLAEKIKKISQYGWEKKYDIKTFGGLNSRLDEIQAAVVLEGLKTLDSRNGTRREIVERYSKALVGKKTKILTSFSEGSVCHLAVLLLPSEVDRSEIRAKFESKGVQTDIHYPKLDTEQAGLAISNAGSFILPNSKRLADSILTIPCYPELTFDEIELICKVMEDHLD